MRFVTLVVALAVAASITATPAAAEPASQGAKRLVALLKPHEKEAQAIRFMLKVAPFDLPDGMADCMVVKATPQVEDRFAAAYAAKMTEEELQDAVRFFQSDAGQAVVAVGLRHRQFLFASAAKGEQVASEDPEYPDDIRHALNAFSAIPAGKHFVDGDFAGEEQLRTDISDIRSAAFDGCLADAFSTTPKTEMKQRERL